VGNVVAGEPAALDACGVRMSDPVKVAAVRAALPPEAAVGGLADVFALLGDPGRLRLLAG
jgi:ArsR family transcriptional regulator, lead/cadmium/zinc/bismuth-responsive transcriptional repressor